MKRKASKTKVKAVAATGGPVGSGLGSGKLGAKDTAAGARLGENSYGKSRVRMLKVSRKGRVHMVRELDVAIALQGDFDAIHTRGDNTNCLPTDTMKNTVYALGKDHAIDTIEEFARDLAEHFRIEHPPSDMIRIHIAQVPWKRVRSRAGEHPHCFVKGSEERQTCSVVVHPRMGYEFVRGGLTGLVLMKTTDSAFAGYPKTRFTTLPETDERVFCTSVSARWWFGDVPADFGACRAAIRSALIDTFAHHKSKSVQHTLYAMGRAALRECGSIRQIRLSMPNKHCLLVNLKPFGMKNLNEIFVPTDEPHGLIEATIVRK